MLDCYVGDKRKLSMNLIVTLVIRRRSVLYLVFYVSDKCKLYLYFIVTLEMSARSVLYLIVALVINAHYICTL